MRSLSRSLFSSLSFPSSILSYLYILPLCTLLQFFSFLNWRPALSGTNSLQREWKNGAGRVGTCQSSVLLDLLFSHTVVATFRLCRSVAVPAALPASLPHQNPNARGFVFIVCEYKWADRGCLHEASVTIGVRPSLVLQCLLVFELFKLHALALSQGGKHPKISWMLRVQESA